MSLSQDTITRQDEVGGKSLRTFKTGSTHIPGVALVGSSGGHAGVQTNPIYTRLIAEAAQGRGRAIVSREVRVFSRTFAEQIDNRFFSTKVTNAGAASPAITIDSGTQAAKILAANGANIVASIQTQFAPPQIAGIGQSVVFRLRVGNVASSNTNERVRWGYGDTTDGVFVEWNGDTPTLRLVSFLSGAAVVNVDAGSWDTPVAYGGLLLAAPQDWMIQHDWLGQTIKVYLDGTLVHTASYPTRTLPVTGVRDLFAKVECENVGTPSTNSAVYLHSMSIFYEGDNGPWSGADRYYASSYNFPITEPDEVCPLHLRAQANVTSDVTTANRRPAHIRRIRVSGYSAANASTDWLLFQVRKGIIGAGTATVLPGVKKPVESDVLFSGLTPTIDGWISCSLSGSAANNSGYADNDLVRYKVTALGARGETDEGSFITSQLDVSSPAEGVTVQVAEPIPWARAYRVYREINTSGIYALVAEVDAWTFNRNGFVDDGYYGSAGDNPPGADTAEHASFMIARSYTAVSGYAAGNIIHQGIIDARQAQVELEFEKGELMVLPGESIGVVSISQKSGSTSWVMNCDITWEEEE